MKKFFMGLITLVTLTVAATAGEAVKRDTLPIYVGVAYTYMDNDVVGVDNSVATFLAGYQVNKYVAVEGRIGTQFNNTNDYTYGIYLKPQVSVATNCTVYGLLGYGGVEGGFVDSGVSYGVGTAYAVNDAINVFVDYTGTDTDLVVSQDTINVGLTYNF